MRCASLLVVATLMASTAFAGPPIDGPAEPASVPNPPALLPSTSEPRPRTWEERHVWEERGTFVGILGGAFVGGAGSVALIALAAEATNPGAAVGPDVAIAMGIVALYGGALGAYAGGFVGAGIGLVLDAANEPGPETATPTNRGSTSKTPPTKAAPTKGSPTKGSPTNGPPASPPPPLAQR